MQADANREWFLYYNEKEMGPFPESEVRAKLKSGEINETAYVYTDGMSDWAVLKETPAFQAESPTGLERSNTNTIGGSEFSLSNVSQVKSGFSGPGEPSLSAMKGFSAPSGASDVGEEFTDSGLSSLPLSNTRSKLVEQGAKEKSKTSSNTKDSSPKGESKNAAAANSKVAKTSKNPKSKRLLFAALGTLALASIGYYWMDQSANAPKDPGTANPNTETSAQSSPASPSKATNESGQAGTPASQPQGQSQTQAQAQGQPPAPPPAPFSFSDLQRFRGLKDSKGPPFRLADQPLNPSNPIILGVLSPLVPANFVNVAVYPENDKNLMIVPRIWYLKLPVLDGFFSVGPLSDEDGAELAPGTYKVLVFGASKLLGEAAIDVGQWPNGPALKAAQDGLTSKRLALAEREKISVGAKTKQISSAFDQLQKFAAYAQKGPRGAKGWRSFSGTWIQTLNRAIAEQNGLVSGPMFYPEAQQKLLGFMKDLYQLHQSYDIWSKGGAKMLAKSKKTPVAKQLSDLSRIKAEFMGLENSLAQAPIKPLLLDPERIKQGLVLFAQSNIDN